MSASHPQLGGRGHDRSSSCTCRRGGRLRSSVISRHRLGRILINEKTKKADGGGAEEETTTTSILTGCRGGIGMLWRDEVVRVVLSRVWLEEEEGSELFFLFFSL